MKKDLNFTKDLYIAHRGAHNELNQIPENSMLAFKKAIENKSAFEIDLHLLKDHEIIVFHDDNLKRMTGYDKDVRDCTYEEIKDLKLLETNEVIPLFRDVLKLIEGKVLIVIEFKCDNKAGLLEAKACELLDDYQGKFLVTSFNPFSVKWFKDHRPQFIRGQLSYDFNDQKMSGFRKYILRNMLLNFLTKPDFVAYDIHSISNKVMNKLKMQNIPLFLWTIRTIEDLALAKTYGNIFIYENIKCGESK